MSVLKKIFLIEADEGDQFFFKQALSQLKNALLVGTAKNGKQALKMIHISKSLPDLIFLDINMPVTNSVEFLKQQKLISTFKPIPIIVLAASLLNCEILQMLGAKSCIEKPLYFDVWRDKIAEVINTDFK